MTLLINTFEGGTAVGPFYMDDLGLSNVGYLGPVGGGANALGSGSPVAFLITQGVL